MLTKALLPYLYDNSDQEELSMAPDSGDIEKESPVALTHYNKVKSTTAEVSSRVPKEKSPMSQKTLKGDN